MTVLREWLVAATAAGLFSTGACAAQSSAPVDPGSPPSQAASPAAQSASSAQPPAAPASPSEPTINVSPSPAVTPSDAPASAKKTYTVPAGTKVLLELRSAIDTRSAKPGDGVYLSSTFPVVVGTRVMIPSGVYVQGVVDNVVRAGRVHGRAQLDMHFTTIIFPNGSVVEIPGVVDSLPGSKSQQVKGDEGTIEQNPDKTRNAGKVAEVTIPTGATIGTIGGISGGHPIAGSLGGVGAGLAAMGLVTLFTRGADVNIPSGTQVEMVLQRPLILEEANLAGQAGTGPTLVPAADQPKPVQKPGRVFCPPGGLGCQ